MPALKRSRAPIGSWPSVITQIEILEIKKPKKSLRKRQRPIVCSVIPINEHTTIGLDTRLQEPVGLAGSTPMCLATSAISSVIFLDLAISSVPVGHGGTGLNGVLTCATI